MNIILEFPDPQESLIGMNLFYSIKETKSSEVKKKSKFQGGKMILKQLA
jgi:hypothetical protein